MFVFVANINSQTFYDDFTGLAVDTLAGQSNWVKGGSGPDALVDNTTPLTYTDYNGGGLEYVTMGLPSSTSSRVFKLYTPITSYTGTTFYFSFLLRLSSASLNSVGYFMTLGDAVGSTSSLAPKLYATANGTGYNIGLSKTTTSVANGLNYGTTVLNFDQTYLVVVRYTFNASGTVAPEKFDDEAYLWINPALSSEPSTSTAECTASVGGLIGSGDTDFDGYGLIAGGVGSFMWHNRGLTNPVGDFDAVRVGHGTTSAEAWTDLDLLYTPPTPVDVTFEVDMGVQAFKGLFDPQVDKVYLSGSFNGWNTTADEMTDLDGDTVYSVTKSLVPGEQPQFKFVRNTVYEDADNRTFTVPAQDTTYFAYFSNDSNYQITFPVAVTFYCNMELEIVAGRFNPATDTLTTRGSFNGWANTDYMDPSGGDPNIYQTTLNIKTFEGEVLGGKFAYVSSGSTTWENDPNKEYTVTADDISNGYAVIERGFNNLTLDNVTNNDVTIKFTVNMVGAVSSITGNPFPSIDDVRLCGANAPLKWPAGGWPDADSALTIKLYDNGTNGDVTAGDNIWSRNVVFTQYSPLKVEYKYGANWGLASNTGGNDNESSIGTNHWINLTPYMTGGTVYNIWATMDTTDLTDVTGIENQNTGTPMAYELNQNYPNPFNPSTLIRYAIPEQGIVTLRVYNLLGEEVVTLVDGFKNAGSYDVTFNASNLSSGIYFYQINSNNFVSTKKMILMK